MFYLTEKVIVSRERDGKLMRRDGPPRDNRMVGERSSTSFRPRDSARPKSPKWGQTTMCPEGATQTPTLEENFPGRLLVQRRAAVAVQWGWRMDGWTRKGKGWSVVHGQRRSGLLWWCVVLRGNGVCVWWCPRCARRSGPGGGAARPQCGVFLHRWWTSTQLATSSFSSAYAVCHLCI